jgi:hypothetical protein
MPRNADGALGEGAAAVGTIGKIETAETSLPDRPPQARRLCIGCLAPIEPPANYLLTRLRAPRAQVEPAARS